MNSIEYEMSKIQTAPHRNGGGQLFFGLQIQNLFSIPSDQRDVALSVPANAAPAGIIAGGAF